MEPLAAAQRQLTRTGGGTKARTKEPASTAFTGGESRNALPRVVPDLHDSLDVLKGAAEM
jgi:hypothetical protein